jgi:hypothetical protein
MNEDVYNQVYYYYIFNDNSNRPDYIHPHSFRYIKLFLRAKTLLVTHGLSDIGRLRPSSRKYVIRSITIIIKNVVVFEQNGFLILDVIK